MQYEYVVIAVVLCSSLLGVLLKRLKCKCGCGCLSCAMATPRFESGVNTEAQTSNITQSRPQPNLNHSVVMFNQLMQGLSPRTKKKLIESMAIP